MFAVIFEVQPKSEAWDTYLDLAKLLRPELEQIDGFIANERFASQRTEGKVLSLSIWRDEKALIRWRTHALHHDVQERGRTEVFAGYHLRVGEITADSQLPAGHEPAQQRFDTTMVGEAKTVSIVEAPPAIALPAIEVSNGDGLIDLEDYEGITVPSKTLRLASWRDGAALAAEQSNQLLAADNSIRRRTVRIIRDYDMFDRTEAPQYFPSVSTSGSPLVST